MMTKKKRVLLLVLWIYFSGCVFAQEKSIAITIDDLPFVGASYESKAKAAHEHFQNLLKPLIEDQIPVTGFVIAGSIAKNQWALLEQFRAQGYLLGNHTYSHKSLHRMTAAQYISDIDRADKKLQPILSQPKYFRYPYLDESKGEKKHQVQEHLSSLGYKIAPVTIDSKDYRFNAELLAVPCRQREKKLENIKKRYLAYLSSQTVKAEASSKKKHILLLHANLLNSYSMAEVIKIYKDRGYRFISLNEALEIEVSEASLSAISSFAIKEILSLLDVKIAQLAHFFRGVSLA